MVRLIIGVGVPGSGKSTYINETIAKAGGIRVSRDEIRFAMLKDDEDYFAKENEVFKEFTHQIQEHIETGEATIYVDATHINKPSRAKLLNNLDLFRVDSLEIIYFDIPLEECLARNEKRKGKGRTYVPRSVVRRLWSQMDIPTYEEEYEYDLIMRVDEEGKLYYE